jgi:hypothetical protein
MCTLALPLAETLFAQYGSAFLRDSLDVGYDEGDILDPESEDAVTVAFDVLEDSTGRLRHHTGTVGPKNVARPLLLGTDIDKPALQRKLKKHAEAFTLTLTHTSRYKQEATRAVADTTTVAYARNKGYRDGRTPAPSTARGQAARNQIIRSFTSEQHSAYQEGYELGKVAGLLPPKRSPRKSATGGRVFVA